MSEPFTFYRIATEACEHLTAHGYSRSRLHLSTGAWVELLSSLASMRMYDNEGNMHASRIDPQCRGSFMYHGPTGRITMAHDDSLPEGTWQWQEPCPFARWFPPLEDA